MALVTHVKHYWNIGHQKMTIYWNFYLSHSRKCQIVICTSLIFNFTIVFICVLVCYFMYYLVLFYVLLYVWMTTWCDIYLFYYYFLYVCISYFWGWIKFNSIQFNWFKWANLLKISSLMSQCSTNERTLSVFCCFLFAVFINCW